MWYLILLFVVGFFLIPILAFGFPVVIIIGAGVWISMIRKDPHPRFVRTEVFVVLLSAVVALRLWWG